MAALSSANLAALVAKAKRLLRISDDDESFLVDGIAVFCSSTDATAATVAVDETNVTLVITGGADAGTNTLAVGDAANDTLSELAAVIEALSGWEATLVGQSDADSGLLERLVATSALGQANEVTLRYEDLTLLEDLINRSWAVTETYLGFDILATDATEIYETETVGRDFPLYRRPIVNIDLVSIDTQDGLRVSYSGSDAVATVEVTDTSVILRSRAGTVTENELTFASNTTVGAMATAVSAVSGWTGTTVNDGASSLLVRRGARSVGTSDFTLEAWEPTDCDYDVDYGAGVLSFREPTRFDAASRRMRVDYSAGYSTTPTDIEAVVLGLVKGAWDGLGKDMAVRKERLGDYSYELADMAALGVGGDDLARFAAVLDRYRRMTA